MKKSDFADLVESVREGGRILRGEQVPARRYTAEEILGPERAAIIAARRNAKLSQEEFAIVMGVSLGTLRGWEQGRRAPTGPARVLIQVMQSHPKVVREAADDVAKAYARAAKKASARQRGRSAKA